MEAPRDIPRTLFAVLFIGALITLSLWILKPFLPATLWASTIVIATWPLMLRVQGRLWNRRWLAVVVMTGALLVLFILPFTLAVGAIMANAEAIAQHVRSLGTLQIPPLPAWVQKLPFAGDRLAAAWNDLLIEGRGGLAAQVKPYFAGVALWFASSAGTFGALVVQFLLTVLVAGILYSSGETAAAGVRRFAVRLAGLRGEAAVRLAGQAVRGVALGVVLTAIVHSATAGLGLFVAGVPFAAVLTALMFMLSLAQLGPVPVLVPAVAWLYWRGDSGWGTFLLVWTILIAPIDNFLRPILIKKGVDLPLLLVFAGVIGGLVAFGLVGIFIGPVVLAVSFNLLSAWVDADLAHPRSAPAASSTSS